MPHVAGVHLGGGGNLPDRPSPIRKKPSGYLGGEAWFHVKGQMLQGGPPSYDRYKRSVEMGPALL